MVENSMRTSSLMVSQRLASLSHVSINKPFQKAWFKFNPKSGCRPAFVLGQFLLYFWQNFSSFSSYQIPVSPVLDSSNLLACVEVQVINLARRTLLMCHSSAEFQREEGVFWSEGVGLAFLQNFMCSVFRVGNIHVHSLCLDFSICSLDVPTHCFYHTSSVFFN